jgi:hypothetical protein
MKTLSFALALLAAPLLAVASDDPAPPAAETGWMQKLDKDGDGLVSRAEAEVAASERALERFDAIDANKDGYVSKDELDAKKAERSAAIKQRANEHWKSADTDGDGMISKEEAEAGMPMLSRRFDSLDANGDGYISRDEMPAGKRTGPRDQPPTQ